ncbi:MAG: transposase [Methanosarcinaceae archaeon]|nr:transposase [Methanosarcinaceae archaeon]
MICNGTLFLEYKPKLFGIYVLYIEPAYTSQMCSKCVLIEHRIGKEFKCLHCGHI